MPTFVVPGDLHLTEPGLANHRAALAIVDEVNALIRPDFVQFVGDNVQDATDAQFQLFDDLRARIDAPHFALVGDHDVKDDPEARGFSARFGGTFGSTTLEGVRFLRLDTQQNRPVGINPRQIEWLKAEVSDAHRLGERLVLFQHNYPYQIWEDFEGPGLDDWRAIVTAHRFEAIVCGHTHYFQVANDGRNALIAVRSVGDPEGGPPGYLVGHVEGDDFAAAYRSVEDRGPLVLITHPRAAILATGPRHVVRRTDRVEARVWSISAVVSVEGRIDGGDWRAMTSIGPDRWSMPMAALPKGLHRVEARATDATGEVGHRWIEFPVDPTGRYTAVPRAEPAVDRTEFC